MIHLLKGVKKIGGFDVVDMDELRAEHPEMFNDSGSMDQRLFEAEIRPRNFIYIRHDVNSISFTMQNGDTKDGVNGCLPEAVIQAGWLLLEKSIAELEARVAELESSIEERKKVGMYV